MTCKECIHNAVCYRRDCVTSDYAIKCGDYFSNNVIDDIKAEIPILSHWQTDDGQDLLMVADALECIDNHTGKEQ